MNWNQPRITWLNFMHNYVKVGNQKSKIHFLAKTMLKLTDQYEIQTQLRQGRYLFCQQNNCLRTVLVILCLFIFCKL